MAESPFTADWARELLRAAGLRATAARICVLRTLAGSRTPLSHAEVVSVLGGEGFDQSTLFRCLNELADAHLATRLDLGDQTRRFEFRGDQPPDAEGHPHFMCVACGQLSCLEDYTFRLTAAKGANRRQVGVITEVLLRGTCERCGTKRG